MAELKLTVKNLKVIDGISKDLAKLGLSKSEVDRVGRNLVVDMLSHVSRGVSPISGKPFPKYKNQEKYPGYRKTKVDLYNTGEFYNALKYEVSKAGPESTVKVGFFDEKNALKEQGHRDGANDQPKRPIIPLESEKFTSKIIESMLNLVKRFLNDEFKKKFDRK